MNGNALFKAEGEGRRTRAEPAIEEPVISRVALHAQTLEFTHPTTGERVKFEAPLPADMQHLLDLLRRHRKQ